MFLIKSFAVILLQLLAMCLLFSTSMVSLIQCGIRMWRVFVNSMDERD